MLTFLIFFSQIWPGAAAFPDFSHPDALAYWTKQVEDFHQKVPFDGLWLVSNLGQALTAYSYSMSKRNRAIISDCILDVSTT